MTYDIIEVHRAGEIFSDIEDPGVMEIFVDFWNNKFENNGTDYRFRYSKTWPHVAIYKGDTFIENIL